MRATYVGRALIPIGLILMVVSIFIFRSVDHIRDFRKTEAVVSRLEHAEDEYTDEQGQHHAATDTVYVKYTADGKEYEEEFGVFSGYKEGDRLSICYNPMNPTEISSPTSIVLPIAMLGGGAAAFIGGIISLIRAARRHKALRKQETELIPYEGDVNIEILKRFLMAKTARGLSKRTLELYKNSISMTLAKIGKPYSQVTADDIRLYLAIRVNRDGVSKTCANNERRNLSAFYTWLQKEEILIKNPMAKVEPIKETKKKKKAYTNMDLEKIRYACEDEMDRALVEVLISTWARISEIASIKISDIDGNKIIVHGKGDKYRMVYLTAKAQLAIKAYLEKRNDDAPLLFPKGRPAKELIKSGIKTKDLHLWWTSPENIESVVVHKKVNAFASVLIRIILSCA